MQHVLGMILRGNNAEVMDDDSLTNNPDLKMDLFSAMAEADRRMTQNPEIMQINVYEVFDGVKRISPQGRYGLVHMLKRG